MMKLIWAKELVKGVVLFGGDMPPVVLGFRQTVAVAMTWGGLSLLRK